ncbi:uncharacterized protein LOC122263288 [Penaeus japonicus]|uniref:uncharacterized protein LOC122263288 n=1 Tax=Penaeus japonicus TaxID=27405 RepID=UPI001C714B0C|nr:uncharacterized protein LOC122263288 [Penaeus japonicus]
MNNVLILLAAVGLSCVLVAHGSPTIGLLTGFGALRASSIQSKRRFHGPGYGRYHGHGYKAPRRRYRPRYGRSVQTDTDADENLLLSIVEHLDPEGCIPKTLCLLEAKDESDRSPDEAQLLEVFANNTRGLTSPNAAFVHAAQVGAETRDSSACDRLFAKCSLDEDQLSEVLRLSWSCDCDSEERQDAPSS